MEEKKRKLVVYVILVIVLIILVLAAIVISRITSPPITFGSTDEEEKIENGEIESKKVLVKPGFRKAYSQSLVSLS